MKPVAVFRTFAMLHYILKRGEAFAAMIEHGIEHDPDSLGMTSFHEPLQQGVIAKMRINLLIIDRIVLMVGRGSEKRCEIYRINAKIGQIVKMVEHALKIPAEIVVDFRSSAPRLGRLRVVGRIAIGEAFRHNLIKYSLLGPFGNFDYIDFMNVRKFVQIPRRSRGMVLNTAVQHIYGLIAGC
ncbi:hypothetical protein D3C77_555660 [compost metagenome]